MGEIFFWTATINKWQRLLLKDNYKNVIINSLRYLSDAAMVRGHEPGRERYFLAFGL